MPHSGTTAAAAIAESLTRSIRQIVAPSVPEGDTLTHQMRVGCRRLRSNLRTFEALLEPRWCAHLRTEVGALADALGPVRDAEVLLERIAAHNLPGVDAIAAALRDRHAQAQEYLQAHLASPRHAALLASLAEPPPFLRVASFDAATILPVLVAKPWHRVARRARALRPDDPDERWHATRIRAKRARYAVEAVAPALDGQAPALAKALARCQDVLGEHQDAVIAAETWQELAPDPALAQVLTELEHSAAHRARKAFPPAWSRCDRPKRTAWLEAPHQK
jgi:CHAD domain-containing protein